MRTPFRRIAEARVEVGGGCRAEAPYWRPFWWTASFKGREYRSARRRDRHADRLASSRYDSADACWGLATRSRYARCCTSASTQVPTGDSVARFHQPVNDDPSWRNSLNRSTDTNGKRAPVLNAAIST